MPLEGNYSFAGVGAAEAKDREDERRVGVPTSGQGLTALLSAPALRTTGVKVMNQGEATALVALAHGSGEKTVSGEHLAALDTGTLTTFRGQLQFGSIKPGTLVITNAGAPDTLIDDGAGLLVEQATPTVQRGTVDYRTGTVDFTYGAAATAPVVAAYTHTDWVQFAMAQTQTFTAAAAYPETFQTQFGRVVPGSVALTDGALTFVDDGKGNMIETGAGGPADVVGTVDYATGVITLTSGSVALSGVADAVVVTYSFNPFASLLVAGGGTQGVPLMATAIPELSAESFGDGIKGESRLALLGVSRDAAQSTHLVTWWSHHIEDSYRVEDEYGSFPPGGATNDPRVSS